MNLDIQEITNNKIKEMHDSGKIKSSLEDGIEKLILKSVEDSLNGWEIRKNIEKQISDNISGVINDIGFSAYNGYIANIIKKITEEVMRTDVADKIQKTFNDMLIIKHDGIKLSEIFSKYKEWVCDHTDDAEKYERKYYHCKFDMEEDGNFTHYHIEFSDDEIKSYKKPQVRISICVYGEKESENISSLEFDGCRLDEKLILKNMTDFEVLLANIYYNKTKIILDVDDVDDENSFDIDF